MAFVLKTPRSPREAFSLARASPDGAFAVLAGGTDLLLDIDDRRISPSVVLSLRKMPWKQLVWAGDQLTIGSTLPLRELELDRRVRERSPGLWQSIRAVGSVALRHRATLGGNLGRASPASDLIPILLALDASVELVGPKGERELPLAEFIQGPRQTALLSGELIRAVTIPEVGPSEYSWQRVRPAGDISQVGVAVTCAARPPYWRLALGGVWPCPQRVPTAERILTSQRPSEVEIELAAQEAAQVAPFITDRRATEAYRRRLVTTLLRRAIGATVLQVRQRKENPRS
ncbi:MAG: FAD binding domain-containing protein [Thermoplasmata archaeon]